MVYWLISRMDKRTTYMFHRKGAKARGKIFIKILCVLAVKPVLPEP